MLRERLLLLSYPLGYLGLFAFTQWVVSLFFTQVDILFVRILLVLGALSLLMVLSLLQGGSYLAKVINSFPQVVQKRCQSYFSYLDRVSLILFVGLGVSLFLGDFVYVLLTKLLFYVALGFYLSSSVVILLFLSRK